MKVVTSLYQFYNSHLDYYNLLKKKVDQTLGGQKRERWHYESRIKTAESFALKMETGRIKGIKDLEDMFACTLVVENNLAINDAINLIENLFSIRYRRPKDQKFTHKKSDSFPFDDLRLYVKLKTFEKSTTDPISDITFEIQIKTFLQHAWSIATHDLVYKGGDICWAKQRIAYQIKAMLEHAEISIEGVSALAGINQISKETKETKQLKKYRDFFNDYWSPDDLPDDIIRLAQNLNCLCEALKLELSDIRAILNSENNEGRGANTKNLSPFLILLQSIILQKPKSIQDFLKSEGSKRYNLFIPQEIITTNEEISRARFTL